MEEYRRRFALPATALAAASASFALGWALCWRYGRRRQADIETDEEFDIFRQLAEGKHKVTDLPLCTLLLMDDSRYPWVVLVPRKEHVTEVTDLPEDLQQQMWREAAAVAEFIQQRQGVSKLNIASLGNVCSQLHVHVTGRHPGDAAWPGPCYGVGKPEPYSKEQLLSLVLELQEALQDYWS